MINELIEKEIEKLLYGKCEDITFDKVREACRTITKEVAMRFKDNQIVLSSILKDVEIAGYNKKIEETNNLADQIINEVSE